MKSHQAPKKVFILRERVKKALWFAKSFVIQFTEIKCAYINGKIYDLLNEKQSTNYTSLVDMEKEKVNCIKTVSNEKVIAVWKSFETIYTVFKTRGLHLS